MALATDAAAGEIILTSDIHGSADAYSPELTATGVVPGEYIGADVVVDVKGRVLYADDSSFTLPCASASSCGGVKIPTAGHIDLDDTGLPNIGTISIPNASAVDYGVVQIGTGFASDGCCIHLDYPVAASTTDGLIIVGTGLDVDGSGNLSSSLTTESSVGLMQVGNGLDVAAGVISVDLTEVTFDLATESSHGIMQVGSGLDVDGSGIVSVDFSEVEEDATTSSKGIVQIGTNIDVVSGVISVADSSAGDKGVMQTGTGLTATSGVVDLDIASAGALGGIKVGTGLGIDGSGVLSRGQGDATTSSKGIVQIGTNIDVASGVISVAEATGVDKGFVQPGTNINISSSEISVDTADNTTLGLVKSADTNHIVITAGAIDVGSNVPFDNTANNYTKSQTSNTDTLTYGASITPDFSQSNVFELTLTGNTTINAPTNSVGGGTYIFIIKQDVSGSHTVTFNSAYKFKSTPTITPTASAVDLVNMVCMSSSEFISQHTTDYS